MYALLSSKAGTNAPQKRKYLILAGAFLVVLLVIAGTLTLVLWKHTSTNNIPQYNFSSDRDVRCVEMLQEYLKIRTDQPSPNYFAAMQYLNAIADMYGFDFYQLELLPGKPAGFIKIQGSASSLPSVLLYSHTDVVPAEEDKWSYPPFGGVMDSAGNIYGRGVQDMKSVSIQYIEAMHRLKTAGIALRRTVYILFFPDEELGGLGMQEFVGSKELVDMNVGIALDEGLATIEGTYPIFIGQRSTWMPLLIFKGNVGHGSRFIENSAIQQANTVLTAAYEYREQQEQKQIHGNLTLGYVTTLNPTRIESFVKINGVYSVNVVPSECTLAFDIRMTPADYEEVKGLMKTWTENLNVTVAPTDFPFYPVSDWENNPWWHVVSDTFSKLNATFYPDIFSASNDGRFLRAYNYTVFGFSPMKYTPPLLHDHDEYLNNKTLLEGVTVYEVLIQALADYSV